MSDGGMMLFSGNSNPALVEEVAGWLNLRLGRAIVGRFSDGEVTLVMEFGAEACMGDDGDG